MFHMLYTFRCFCLLSLLYFDFFFFFKQKTAYEMRISDWSSDVCSSDLSRDRIPFLDQGVVDLIASTMTANEDRAQQVQFTYTYYVAGQSLLVPKNSTQIGRASCRERVCQYV